MTSHSTQTLESLRTDLFRIARLQLRDAALAEDVVSETLVSALEKQHTFAGRSQMKTWLVGILKHKIIDCLRAQLRQNRLRVTPRDDEDIEDLLFRRDGHFAEQPVDWGDPERKFEQTRFFDVLELCVTDLPSMQGRVFLMKEWFEFTSDEIGAALGLSTGNVNVMLHRARLRLRECLQTRWFGEAR